MILRTRDETDSKTVVEGVVEGQHDRDHDQDPGHTEYRNNAEKVLELRIDTTASTETCHGKIQEIVETLCPFLLRGEKNCPFDIKPMTGGLSNRMFLVSKPFSAVCTDENGTNENTRVDTRVADADTNTVLVRIHTGGGEGNDDCDDEVFTVVDRESETKLAAWLASQREDLPHNSGSMAPTVYGRFENGRVEEFYRDVRPLASAEMKTHAPWIAQSLASFHSLKPPSSVIAPRPVAKDGTGSSCTIYETIRAWLKEAKTIELDEASTNFLNELCDEWDWLANELANKPKEQSTEDNPIVAEALDFIRRVSITHMDCQPLNILIDDVGIENCNANTNPTPDSLRLIDFEFTGWNPVAADIANTFCEYCEMSNLCADYDKEYPSPTEQDTFFWHYLLQSDPLRAKQFSSYSRRHQRKTNINYDWSSDNEVDKEWLLFSATLKQEVGRFSLLSHLVWAIWSILKSEEDVDFVDFDYMEYARHRMDGYAWAKKKFRVAAKSN